MGDINIAILGHLRNILPGVREIDRPLPCITRRLHRNSTPIASVPIAPLQEGGNRVGRFQSDARFKMNFASFCRLRLEIARSQTESRPLRWPPRTLPSRCCIPNTFGWRSRSRPIFPFSRHAPPLRACTASSGCFATSASSRKIAMRAIAWSPGSGERR